MTEKWNPQKVAPRAIVPNVLRAAAPTTTPPPYQLTSLSMVTTSTDAAVLDEISAAADAFAEIMSAGEDAQRRPIAPMACDRLFCRCGERPGECANNAGTFQL